MANLKQQDRLFIKDIVLAATNQLFWALTSDSSQETAWTNEHGGYKALNDQLDEICKTAAYGDE